MTGIVFTGMWYAVGKTLSVWLAGLDCGDHLVAANGTLTVPYQSDPDGLMTPAYLNTVAQSAPGWPATTWRNALPEIAADITVTIGGLPTNLVLPCVVGANYLSQGQIVRPNAPDEAKTTQGAAMGATRRTYQYSAHLIDAIGVQFGTDFSHLYTASLSDASGKRLNSATGFTGIHWDTLDADYDFDNMLCWTTTRPMPCTIVSVEGFMEVTER
jgi:hypothetical protein